MEPGSEFQSKETLHPLFCHHEYWERTSTLISKGVLYPLEDISTEAQKEDLLTRIERGNHKSASNEENEPTLVKNHEKKVNRGWMLPVTI